MKAVFLIGPSGSGKSSLSLRLHEIYSYVFGKSTTALVNLDPANHNFPHNHININDLITVEDVMEEYEIGPNGAIIFAMEFLLLNLDWLEKQVENAISGNKISTSTTFIFDLPGQIQLYVNNNSVKNIISALVKKYNMSACILELFDSTYMHDINQFISLCMMSLSTIINLELPHINVLNKIDLLKGAQQKPSRGMINEYFSVSSAHQLVQQLKPMQEQGNQTFTDVVAKVIDTYGQVSFMPGSLFKQHLVGNLVCEMEKVFGTLQVSMLNEKFRKLTKDCGDFFAHERAICELENELGEEEEMELQHFTNDIGRQQK